MSARDPRRWMWAEACELLDQAERLQRQFFELSAAPRARWRPPVDVMETEQALIVLAALPGVPADRIEVLLEQGVLLISGHRPLPAELRGAALHRLELPHGRFQRAIELPAGRFRLRRQELRDGCLVLELEKR
ncbi:Hsp20/alpha crystallin family protein [Alkalilimnicola sp. S0819]|uniref:Hsp20/alpha crystallin family protein n=1 Tax=Alkalilimnicola sp. S0819 TaxID=2613922 RepID=UPI0012628112|nr:Hsp20/alpha crystallin family protein [Alkalilimnicola sp. S0819]KAB7628184.1 Hsp20/alpha crystallin family protein [Alkalilimnicola sp. S0819]MPQ15072.1 Hsp20 family protein [Alkalilimnicola sp. S0819]